MRLSNVGEVPALTQLWIDRGDAAAVPSELDVPFIISSPLLRIDSKQSHTVRIVSAGAKLPTDQETLFWLNMLEVPPKPDEKEVQNYLQFSVRTRVKLFYRPAAIKGGVAQAMEQVQIKILKTNPYKIQVVNASPLFISFAEVWMKQKGVRVGEGVYGMVSPFQTLDLEFNPIKEPANQLADSVEFTALDEYGANIPLTVSLE